MGPVRVLILAVALTSAVGAAVIVRGMAQGQAPPPAVTAEAPQIVERPMAEVLIAKRDLPPGTIVAEQDVAWQAWPQDSLNDLFITKAGGGQSNEGGALVKAATQAATIARQAVTGPEPAIAELVGTVVREAILAGEPVTKRKLVRAGSAGLMAITLQPGMRAMAIPLSAESAAGGFILPGDHVDVVQSRQMDDPSASGGQRYISETVLRNAKVLAIDQATGSEDAAVIGATATLELSPNQAEVLVLARSQGDLTLVLRSYADTDGPTETVQRGQANSGGFNAAVVRIYRDGQTSEVTVNR